MLLWLPVTLCPVAAQEVTSWEQIYEEIMSVEEESDIWEANHELLQELAAHPLDINSASREELEQLPFLSEQQVMDLMEYLEKYGPMRSMGELRMVRSMDYRQLQLLPFFIYIGEVPETEAFPGWKQITDYGHHTLTATAKIPFYSRKGDQNGYMGYRYKHSLRYEFAYGSRIKAGVVGAQDAGEPFAAGRNRWGYDAYSYYIQLNRWGIIEALNIGKFKVSSGMGLVLNNSFSLGKSTILQNLGRQTRSIRAHASASEADYFQGAGVKLRLSRPWTVMAFASHRPMDATLNDDGTAATLITSGYHRTEKELEKKYNTHQTTIGSSIVYRDKGMHIGITAAYTHMDRSLEPDRNVLYRRHQAHGNHFLNASIDYGYLHHRFAFNGETATDRYGALATLNAMSYQPSGALTLLAVQRYYSYRYTSLHAHAFSETGHVQNESGLYLGAQWKPLENLNIQAYADWAYSPWARYRVSQASWSKDYQLDITWEKNGWTVKGRHRMHLRQRDNEEKTGLRRFNEHRSRLSVSYKKVHWQTTTQLDFSQTEDPDLERGWMVSEQLALTLPKVQLNLTTAYFDTDSYASRLYLYEPQLPRQFSMPTFYDRGFRFSLRGRVDISKLLQLNLKAGITRYLDLSSIGSGLQQINHSSQADLEAQLRLRI